PDVEQVEGRALADIEVEAGRPPDRIGIDHKPGIGERTSAKVEAAGECRGRCRDGRCRKRHSRDDGLPETGTHTHFPPLRSCTRAPIVASAWHCIGESAAEIRRNQAPILQSGKFSTSYQ